MRFGLLQEYTLFFYSMPQKLLCTFLKLYKFLFFLYTILLGGLYFIMSRFFYVIFMNLWRAFYMIPLMQYKVNHPEKYTLQERYDFAKWVLHHMQRTGKITTKAYGLDNLPKENGYVMYSNHQGKYDALGIVDMHKRPCSIVIDDSRSHTLLTSQFIDLLESKRLMLNDIRQQVKIIQEIVNEIKEKARNFLIFPEGGYTDNHNMVCHFKEGSFKCAIKAKAPIVPVAIINSWKVFEKKGLEPVETQVRFLKPLYYEDYKEMSTKEIAGFVQTKIQQTILDNLAGQDLETLQNQLA